MNLVSKLILAEFILLGLSLITVSFSAIFHYLRWPHLMTNCFPGLDGAFISNRRKQLFVQNNDHYSLNLNVSIIIQLLSR